MQHCAGHPPGRLRSQGARRGGAGVAERVDAAGGVSVRRDLQPDVPPIVGHRSQLQEVLTNLLQNALEAMDASQDHRRVLTVRTRRDGDKAIIEVEDTGPGVDATRLDKVFEPFVTTKPGGMGLGLAICRTIVDRHGGQLSASPARPRGTVFRMVLPAR